MHKTLYTFLVILPISFSIFSMHDPFLRLYNPYRDQDADPDLYSILIRPNSTEGYRYDGKTTNFTQTDVVGMLRLRAQELKEGKTAEQVSRLYNPLVAANIIERRVDDKETTDHIRVERPYGVTQLCNIIHFERPISEHYRDTFQGARIAGTVGSRKHQTDSAALERGIAGVSIGSASSEPE